jgi:hypothetical protein
MIRDSRTLYGPQPHETAEQIEAHWAWFAEKHGRYNVILGVREPPSELRQSKQVLQAYVSDSRWVADCPCGGGIGCWPEHDKGCCYDCLTVYRIAFPSPSERAAAETVLLARLEPSTRNWRPDLGEELIDLKVENVTHGEGLS